jgi:hypothetical protein
MRYQAPRDHIHSVHDDGRCYVHDPVRDRSWEVGPGALEILRAVRVGWEPGGFLPGGLRARLAEEGLTEADLPSIVEDLASQGLLTDGQPGAPAKTPWTVRLFAVPAPPAYLRPLLVRLAQWAPLAAAGVLGLAVVAAARDGQRLDPVEPRGLLALVAAYLLGQALLIVPHELGHALVLAAATGRRVGVGLRLGGWPLLLHAFTEASLLYTVPARSVRVAVLLAGTVAELLVWGALLLCRPALPGAWQGVLATVVALGGVWSVVGNLLLPIRNDGYYVLADLTRADDLEQRARHAARQAFFASGESADGPWWLAWYGLFATAFTPAVVLLAGLQLHRMGAGAPAVVLAVPLAATLLRRSLASTA